MNTDDTAKTVNDAKEALTKLFISKLAELRKEDTPVTLANLEDELIHIGHDVMAQAFGETLTSFDLLLCKNLTPGHHIHDRYRRTLATKIGDVTFTQTRTRNKYKNDFSPLADELDMPRGIRISPAACDFLIEAACDMSYARAARLLHKSGGSCVSATAVMRAMQIAGGLCEQEDNTQAKALYQQGLLPGGTEIAEELMVEADGTWFSVQKPKEGDPRRLEVKAVVAYSAKERAGSKVKRKGVVRHACVASPEQFSAEAVASIGKTYDLSKIKTLHVGSDGEPWCKNIGRWFPYGKTECHLDPFHVNRAIISCFTKDDKKLANGILSVAMQGGATYAASLIQAAEDAGVAKNGATRVAEYLRSNAEIIYTKGPSLGTMEAENQHIYGVRMDSFPCAWSVQGASNMARLRGRSVSGRTIPRQTRDMSLSAKRRRRRKEKEYAFYERKTGVIPESTGHGYAYPHQASVAQLSPEVRYIANVDGGMTSNVG